MRKTVLLLNGIVIVFFTCFITYTFFAQKHLEGLARNFVTEKTLEYSDPLVGKAEEALESPVVRKLLPDDQEQAIQSEISQYHKDSSAYVADLTGQQVGKLPPASDNPLLAKVMGLKEKVRVFYQNTLDALILDLRIMAVCNLIAGIIAFVLAYRGPVEIRKTLVGFSMLIFIGVIYCSYLYVDDLNFFHILFRWHMGWSYAGFLCIMIASLYYDHGKEIMKLAHEEDGPEISDKNS